MSSPDSLADRLVRSKAIISASVEAAFREVPRHEFLPNVPLDLVYGDHAVTTKRSGKGRAISSSTQPTIMAGMLEQLGLEPGQRVLEVGTGTGFNAALMANIVGEAGQVVTMDVDDDIVDAAREHLAAAGYGRVRAVPSDGVEGYPAGAPYDRIILTVGAHDIGPAWRAQLATGGRLVLPLVLRARQKSIAFDDVNGVLTSTSMRSGIVFMTLRETAIVSQNFVQLGSDGLIALEMEDAGRADPETWLAALARVGGDRRTDIRITADEATAGLGTWLELHDPGFCHIFVMDPGFEHERIPDLVPGNGFRATFGLRDDASLALLSREARSDETTPDVPFPLSVRMFGTRLGLIERLLARIQIWDEAGRPADESLRVRAYPLDAPPVSGVSNGRYVELNKAWNRLVCDWPERAPRS